ncbi:MAG: hypothetical protein FWD00_02275 [Clostridiales bacterium]|nr:hypothetical protein [Clostridiales bacterium]
MRKLLAILLTLSLVFSMTAVVFADDDAAETANGTYEVAEGTADEEAIAEEEEGDEAPVFEIPVPERVVVSTQALMIDGELVETTQPYNIDGSNYFRLRDLAALMNGTGSQFNVTFEAPYIVVTTGEAYEALGTELVIGDDLSATTVPSTQVLMVDGETVEILVYNIGGYNYFQLRGLGELIGFTVDFDEATRTIIVETAVVDSDDDEDDEDDDDNEDDDDEDDEDDDEEGDE